MGLDNVVTNTKPKFNNYTKEMVSQYLSNPISYQTELRDVVDYLIIASPLFNLLCIYLPFMSLFNYEIIPNVDDIENIDVTKMKKDYIEVCKYVDKLNIKKEFGISMMSNFYYDSYFGYEIEDDDNYFIKLLNPKYCRIYGMSIEGCYLVEFDFSYFKGKNEELVNGDKLGRVAYPKEFKKKYEKFKKEGKDYRWQPLDNGIATKYFENKLEYSIPPYIGLFNDLMDIEDYKELNKASVESDNYKIIALNIPLDEKNGEANKFLLSMDLIQEFQSILQSQIPEGVGFFPTPMKPQEITFKKDNLSNKNSVAEATQNVYESTGFSKLLFGGADSSTALKYSVKTDEQKLFHMYRQYESIVNRKLKKNFNGMWKINILNMTKFSEEEVVKQLKENATLGIPVKNTLLSALGISPYEGIGKTVLENDVLKLHEKWIPLQNSYVQSGDGGRPENLDPDSEKTVIGKENEV